MRTSWKISAKLVYFYYGLIPNICTSDFSNVPKGNVSKHMLLRPYKNKANHILDSWIVIWRIFTASGCNFKAKTGSSNAYFRNFSKFPIWQKCTSSKIWLCQRLIIFASQNLAVLWVKRIANFRHFSMLYEVYIFILTRLKIIQSPSDSKSSKKLSKAT